MSDRTTEGQDSFERHDPPGSDVAYLDSVNLDDLEDVASSAYGVGSTEAFDDSVAMALTRGGPAGPTTMAKLRGLPWSIAGNSLNSIFAQFTFFGSVFVLFLNTLGLSKSQIGGLLALLPFTSVLAIFVAPMAARLGYKRTFLTSYGSRKIVTAFLLLTPWVTATYGSTAALRFVTVIVALFAVLRAIQEIAFIPWSQEFVPNAVRGKYAAKDNLFATVAGMSAIAVAGITIGRTQGLTGYMILIAAGVMAGFVAVWCFSFIPGGAPVRNGGSARSSFIEMRDALADADYRRFLLGVSMVTLGIAAVTSFIPLYLQEQAGIPAGRVIWIQIGSLTGAMVSSYIWGWAADRYGSKPVMRSGAGLLAAMPLLWLLLPRNSSVTLYLALGIALFQGLAGLGWVIGAGRLLHVTLVPPAKKAGYLALYAAWVGIVSGISQLAGGRFLDITQGLSAQVGPLTLDPYMPLFLLGGLLTIVAQPALRGIRGEESVSVREFVGLFFQGNPFMAMSSLIRNQMAKDERATVLRTQGLARAHSRLTVEELIDALSDPRYNVRYEAEIAISRMRRDPRLTRAMVEMLEGTELAMSAQAAWALGRMGDPAAIEPLRRSAENPYRSVRMQSVRALGWLGDTESVPTLLEELRGESDKGLQMAYASALGNLRATEATDDLLLLMETMDNPGARMELALALARLVGRDHIFIRLMRQMRTDPGTSAAQTLSHLKRNRAGKRKRKKAGAETKSPLDACIDAFANEDLERGAGLLADVLREVPKKEMDECPRIILDACAVALDEYGAERLEYIVLALHTLNVSWT